MLTVEKLAELFDLYQQDLAEALSSDTGDKRHRDIVAAVGIAHCLHDESLNLSERLMNLNGLLQDLDRDGRDDKIKEMVMSTLAMWFQEIGGELDAVRWYEKVLNINPLNEQAKIRLLGIRAKNAASIK